MRILFCCTGNTCRSPMAEYIAKKYLTENNIQDIEVASCGVMCSNGNPISEMSAKALADIEIVNISHKSKMITLREILEYDYIFVMTKNHKIYLSQELNAGENVLVLGEFVGESDIADPYGGSQEDYNKCRQQLDTIVKKVLDKLLLGDNKI